VILLAHDLWRAIGLKDVRLELNSLGQPPERLAHRAALIAHFEQHQSVLDEDAKRRLYSNPLRILDTKNPAMTAVVESAPKLMDFLGEASLAHFNALRQILDANGVQYTLNPRLVRGMDYYNLTVFEFITDQLGSQGTVCGGGRYDYLIEQVGGKPAPAVGWALGIERVLALLEEQGAVLPESVPHAYAIVPEAQSLPAVLSYLRQFRALGVNVQMHAGSGEGIGSMKSQFKKADSSGAQFALIFGADELANNTVSVKSLRDGGGAQRTESLDNLNDWGHTLHTLQLAS
jgi:histidyl-tRNA synthetase